MVPLGGAWSTSVPEWKFSLKLDPAASDEAEAVPAHAHIRGKRREIKVRIDLPNDPTESADEKRQHIAALVRAALQSAIDEIPFHDPDAMKNVELKTDRG